MRKIQITLQLHDIQKKRKGIWVGDITTISWYYSIHDSNLFHSTGNVKEHIVRRRKSKIKIITHVFIGSKYE